MAIIPSEVGKNIIIDTPQKQKNRKLFMLFVAVLIIAGGIIYFGFGGGGSEVLQPTAGLPGAPAGETGAIATEQQINQSNKILEALKNISLNNLVFTDKKFESLLSSDKLPVAVGEKGRENPFSPF